MDEAMQPTLALESLQKTYNPGSTSEIRVLDNITLTLAPGEAAALVAPSGAGKSTLLHLAGLLDTSSSGRVLIEGVDMTHASDRARTRARRQTIGFVYQFHHLLPEFTAGENIVLPQRAAGVGRSDASARADELLASVGLTERAHHRPAELSGGEQQRVAIARALANRPKLLLADEPTGNLDPDTATIVFDMLMALVRETGLSALVATHNLDLAARMDRIYRLTGGQITESQPSS
ncbi:MAG: ABC transporter ATP-binding protein [Pseudomonadota bacterium]